MSTLSIEHWLDGVLSKHARLTDAVVSIVENILRARQIDYLAVTGRTKNLSAAIEKIERKRYTHPQVQLTDLSGIRIVVFLESDVRRVSKAIRETFRVDAGNSLDKNDLLSANQLGYRSVHFVCDLGEGRSNLPEFRGLEGLQFEFQIRTVLQHAWAELAHDRNYKFSGKLPQLLERKLYLYSGLLEIADKGFDEVSAEIDRYVATMESRTDQGDLNVELTSLSLQHFVDMWSRKNRITLTSATGGKDDLADLVGELEQFGARTLAELQAIVPPNYADLIREDKLNTIYGVVRDWMLMSNWRLYKSKVSFNWIMDSWHPFDKFFDDEEFRAFAMSFPIDPDDV